MQYMMQPVMAILVQLPSACRDSDHGDEVRPVGLAGLQGLVTLMLALHVVGWCLLLALLAQQLCQ